jgi:hypothetical protein
MLCVYAGWIASRILDWQIVFVSGGEEKVKGYNMLYIWYATCFK